MKCYYNEIDKEKAAWLGELMHAGVISRGDIDERSVADVRPDDLRRYTRCHFFAGIGIWDYALRLAGWPEDWEVWTGSCPCQPFSAAGKRKAKDDDRHLWPVWFRLIEARRPVVCFGEQVASIDGLAWFDDVQASLDRAGYTVGCVDSCASGYGAPHIRQRLYWVADSEHAERRPKHQKHGQAHWRNESERFRDVGRLADSSRERRQQDPRITSCDETSDGAARWNRCESYSDYKPSGNGPTGWLAYGDSPGLEERRCEQRDTGQERTTAERDCDAGGLEHPTRDGRLERGGESGGRGATGGCSAERLDNPASSPGERGAVERLADADGGYTSTEREQRSGQYGQQPSDGRNVPMAGPVNGFWADADWVLTRPQRVGDRPGLRPTKRGAFPLVAGATGRIPLLRGAGDGIVAPQAAAFIRAHLEVRG